MPRIAPGVPHHVPQRGNRRQQTFFCHEHYEAYLDEMAQWCAHWGVEAWAYCLMPDPVHWLAVPRERTGRPLGNEAFLPRLETALGRVLRPRKRGTRGPRRCKGTR